LLADHVEAAGLEVERHACGLDTAFISEFGAGDGLVGILSEYDALPGIGHACGHNIIATAGLGAALALNKLGAALPGRVRYLGTPAEERGNGKELMARQGAFDALDAAMMVHPAGVDLITMPSLAVNEVRVTYRGRSAHASAMPHSQQ
jgi:metal-dependent amidase/aminoacylase/carboxypeptidase family protein